MSLPGSAIDRSKQLYAPFVSAKMATYKASEYLWIFKNGSEVKFAHMQDEKDKENYVGAQITMAVFDEGTQFLQSQYDTVQGRIRSASGIKSVTLMATNPDGIGHLWVKARFVSAGAPDKPFKVMVGRNRVSGSPKYMTRVFIPAKLDDNEILMKHNPNYETRLMSLPEAERKAKLDGDWDAFGGQFFSEWRPHIHVIDPFEVPSHWVRSAGYDFGYGSAAVYGLFAIDPHTRLAYMIGEYATVREVEPGKFESVKVMIPQQAERILDLEGGIAPEYRAADPSIFPATQANTGESMSETFATHNVYFQPSDRRRVAGWQRVHAWLTPHLGEQDEQLEDRHGPIAGLRFFRTCRYTIVTLPSLPHSPTNTEDLDTHAEDHAADSLRYWTMARPEPHEFRSYRHIRKVERKQDEHPSVYEDEDYAGGADDGSDMSSIIPRRRR